MTGDRHGNLRVGPASGESPQILTVDDFRVESVAVSPEGRWIASGHRDGTIRLWPMPDIMKPPLHELPHAELLAHLRSLTNLRVAPDPDEPRSARVSILAGAHTSVSFIDVSPACSVAARNPSMSAVFGLSRDLMCRLPESLVSPRSALLQTESLWRIIRLFPH